MALRLVLAQTNTRVGDLAGNRNKILAALDDARRLGADIIVFPEMSITGYPAEDLLLMADFIDGAIRTLQEIIPASHGLTAVVGTVFAESAPHNAAAVLHDGTLAGVYYKQFLPNYGVFDEMRYFRAGQQRVLFVRDAVTFGLSICEDIWYADGPPQAQATQGAELLINISASPYCQGKGGMRERMLATRAADNAVYVAYCNLVGGQDELVFDGHSVICGPDGQVIARGRQFEEDLLIADLDVRDVFRQRLHDPRQRGSRFGSATLPDGNGFERIALSRVAQGGRPQVKTFPLTEPLEPIAEVYQALVLGVRDYVRKNGFRQVVLGLSGGVDSSLTAAIAVDALGSENVIGVAMPTRFSSAHSLEDAAQLAHNFGIRLLTVPIDRLFQAFLDELGDIFQGCSPDVTEENIQPRIRGTVLMALSNKFGWLVLTTGNKSETSVGYSTLYGDTAGGFAVIKDVPKMLVYELSRHRNRLGGRNVIPERVLEKAPSAELRPDQKDTDSLPEYALLDPILQAYVEERRSVDDIARQGFDEETVRRVMRMVDRNEYKRRQSPPGVKITQRAFGKDWRLPVTHQYCR